MTQDQKKSQVRVLGALIDPVSWDEALERIGQLARRRQSSYVGICNAHSVVTAAQDPAFAAALAGSNMNTPDGAPVAWMLRKLGHPTQQRINGPDLMLRYCALASQRDESIFLYGASSDTLNLLQQRLAQDWPTLKIAGAYSPPFRPLSAEEDAAIVKLINDSGAGTVWVSLGCPKQELWMAKQRGHINAVMIGVGAAFDYHAGTLRRAPLWMQKRGLEWFYRLVTEPRRLWRRYLITNTAFIAGAARQLLSR
ncbi:WecB/TagA/CpsF family glycosyltransferase [Roseateles oligotrophus]|uniref:WecB/TagA/CpsF family glycosyltransferase n=1 Tax=Roseateles oligotrophus TaxID=1769250 RepID=A0ABT2YJB2_9BURK|nr:WecB/TagA/CpsF family glycosyltransferase [Roseateles oligotrophus]MCV2370161.1 WecB/TagA/CpsF family glycosyltransferase [Roseateles oligotrophus]